MIHLITNTLICFIFQGGIVVGDFFKNEVANCFVRTKSDDINKEISEFDLYIKKRREREIAEKNEKINNTYIPL
jgi:hypothetical protein